MSKWKAMAERTTILRCVVGSQAYGTSLGTSDRDEKGVCVEDIEAAFTTRGEFEQFEYRSATERTGNKFARSEPGDLDLTIYSLRKALRLMLGGNPNMLELLFIDETIEKDSIGENLQALYPAIVSKAASGAYLGYMKGQQARYFRSDGDGSRKELIDQYGFDVKAAAHVIRLGLQGCELLTTGRLSLPLPPDQVRLIKAIKGGTWSQEQCLDFTKALEIDLKILRTKDHVREEPNYDLVNEWMRDVYLSQWNLRRGCWRSHNVH